MVYLPVGISYEEVTRAVEKKQGVEADYSSSQNFETTLWRYGLFKIFQELSCRYYILISRGSVILVCYLLLMALCRREDGLDWNRVGFGRSKDGLLFDSIRFDFFFGLGPTASFFKVFLYAFLVYKLSLLSRLWFSTLPHPNPPSRFFLF